MEKKELTSLTNKDCELHFNEINCHICKEKFEDIEDINSAIIVFTHANTEALPIAYVI